jgi:two-component system, chemotaxis family, protein-glutamate methylesterase/glutaminase
VKLLTGTRDVVQIELRSEALLTAYSAVAQAGVAIALSGVPSSAAQLGAFLTRHLSGSDLSSLELKIVGTSPIAVPTEKLLRGLGAKNVRSVERDGALSALFYPTSGRLRLARAEAPAERRSEMKRSSKIKVLVVDDSPTIQKLLKTIFESDPSCEVVGVVGLPSKAEEAVNALKPDVITMDIHMPEMNGVQLLKKLHPKYGIPTVMITSVSKEESHTVLEALEGGAVDYIQKPSLNELDKVAPLIIEKVKTAALSRAKKQKKAPKNRLANSDFDSKKILAIGSSTGGTEALREIFESLPAKIPPIVIVQHIPAIFSEALARRLDDLSPFEVKEAENRDEIRPGRVLIAPGGKQMKIARDSDGTLRAVVFDGEAVNRHKPSVDVLFDSVADVMGAKAVGVILTGMGSDGAKGLLKMKNSGARTIAQDENSSVVFGMPKEAIRLGGAEVIAPLDEIAEKSMIAVKSTKRAAA